MQLLTEQVAHLSVEMYDAKKVILHLVEEGLDEQDPWKALSGVVGGVFLLTPGTHPLPGTCWLSFSSIKPLLQATLSQATSGSGGLLTAFSWLCAYSSPLVALA